MVRNSRCVLFQFALSCSLIFLHSGYDLKNTVLWHPSQKALDGTVYSYNKESVSTIILPRHKSTYPPSLVASDAVGAAEKFASPCDLLRHNISRNRTTRTSIFSWFVITTRDDRAWQRSTPHPTSLTFCLPSHLQWRPVKALLMAGIRCVDILVRVLLVCD